MVRAVRVVRVVGPTDVINDLLPIPACAPADDDDDVLGTNAVLTAAALPNKAALPAIERHLSPSHQDTSCHAAWNRWTEAE